MLKHHPSMPAAGVCSLEMQGGLRTNRQRPRFQFQDREIQRPMSGIGTESVQTCTKQCLCMHGG